MAFIPAAIVKTDNPMASRMRKEVCHLIRPRNQITRMVEMRMVSMYSYFEKNTGTPISVTTSRITPPPIAVTVASVRIPKKSIFFSIAHIAPDAANTKSPIYSKNVIRSMLSPHKRLFISSYRFTL